MISFDWEARSPRQGRGAVSWLRTMPGKRRKNHEKGSWEEGRRKEQRLALPTTDQVETWD